MEQKTGIFLVTSGEHPTLPLSEATAILDAYKIDYRIGEKHYKLVELEAPASAADLVAARAGYVEEAGIEIFRSLPDPVEIKKTLRSLDMSRYVSPQESFSVRVARYGGISKEISRVKLEAELGGVMLSQTASHVDLENPIRRFRGILSGPYFHFGLQTFKRPRGSVARRRPRKRPVFHPSTMVPKLARCLVNLACATEDTVFLDPFCGVGGILLEASLLGCPVLGVDALRRMVRGARRNLAHFGSGPLGMILADSRKIPITRVGAIATDPPYGTGASTLKATTKEILRDFLPQAKDILVPNARAVIVSPLGTGASELAEDSGFKVLEEHRVYVHRSLTREILVLSRR
jgi:tRNA (guanine10-N2)-dimethyltransferase